MGGRGRERERELSPCAGVITCGRERAFYALRALKYQYPYERVRVRERERESEKGERAQMCR